MAVLSTLSGTIAIKQYLSNMAGCAIFFPSLWILFLTTKNHDLFIFFHSEMYIKGNMAYRLSVTFMMVSMIFFFFFPQEALQFPLALLTWLNWPKNAVSTATWQLLLMGS